MAIKNRHTANNRRCHFMNILNFIFNSLNLEKTFERLRAGNLAVTQKEILESLL